MFKNLVLFTISIFGILPVLAQTDSVLKKNLKEISIHAERSDLFNIGLNTDKPDSLLKHFANSQSIGSLIDISSGMVVRSYGPGSLASTSLRGGTAQQTSLNWNGLTINSPINGLNDLNLISNFLFSNVIVVPGLAGSMQGSSSIGGGINISDNLLIKKGLSGAVIQSVGSFGNIGSGIKLNFSQKNWKSSTSWIYNQGNNDFPFINRAEAGQPKQILQNTSGKTISVLHQSNWSTIKAGTFKIWYWGNAAKREIPASMLTHESVAFQEDQSHKGMFQWSYQLKNLGIKYRSLWQNDYLVYDDSASFIRSEATSNTFVNDAEVRINLTLNQVLSFGVIQTNSFAEATNYRSKVDRRQTAFWSTYYLSLPKLKSLLNFNIRQELLDEISLPLIPGIGFKTKLTKSFDIFGQVSRVYRVPTLNDLFWFPGGNIFLKSESGWAREMSVKYHVKAFEVTLTGFSRLITDWILWQPVNAQIWSPINIGKVKSQGLEFRSNLTLKLNAKMVSKFGVQANYTESFNDDAKDENYNKQLIYVPYHKLSGTAGISYLKSSFLISGLYVGRRYSSSDNSEIMQSYALLNLAYSHAFTLKKTTGDFFFKANNVFNKMYEAIVWRPMPGFNMELGINYRF